MSEAITFDCTSCGLPYKVAASYAGREFACKKCGARLRVPRPSRSGLKVEPEVELASGTEVMRRTTTSGRQVIADPTRVFTQERETSQRMVATGAVGDEKSGKGMLIAGIVIGVLVLGGAVSAAVLLGGDDAQTHRANSRTVAVEAPEEKAFSERDKLMARLDEGLDAAGMAALLKEAKGKVEEDDLTLIAQRVVRQVDGERGGTLSDGDILKLADELRAMNIGVDSQRLYMVIVTRHGATEPRPEVYVTARRRLGYELLDFDVPLENAHTIAAIGVVDGINEVVEELEGLKKRADDGWSTTTDKLKYEEVLGRIRDAQAKVEEIRKTNPFQFKLVSARLAFAKEKASSMGTWTSVSSKPYVFFVQLQAGEDAAGAEKRVKSAVEAADQFLGFFERDMREPMGLTRTLPEALKGDERDSAPIVFKLFRDPSYWKVHLDNLGHKNVDVMRTSAFMEPATGNVSLVYQDESESLGRFVSAVVDAFIYNYHPNASTNHKGDEKFEGYATYILALYLNSAIAWFTYDEASSTYTFMPDRPKRVATLGAFMKPFEKNNDGFVVSFGGQVLTVKELVGLKDAAHMRQTISDNLGTLKGWSEADLLMIRTARTLESLGYSYLGGLYNFLWHWGPDGTPKYREKFLKFVRSDLDGGVAADNPVPAFEKAFGLDEAGWKQLEADFTTYQSGG